MRRHALAAALVALLALAIGGQALADVKISDQTYVRHDGGTDVTIADCSDDSTTPTDGGDGAGERQANEPAASVDPSNAAHMTAGANDYCPVQTTGDAWAGFYYSNNGGASWVNSLVPGYNTDTSAEGRRSPLFGFVNGAGDPVQAWDNNGHFYYGGIAFNRAKPVNGSIWVARYNWPAAAAAPDYRFTTIVSRGTPGFGHFEDKVQLEVDKGAASPHAGNVYLCWARFTGSASNNFVEFARSTDGGRTFTVQKLSEGIHGNQFCDISVTRNGTVFVAWRQFEFGPPNKPNAQRDAVVWVKSTNGGVSFTKPREAAGFVHWDLTDHFGSPEAAGQARYDTCHAADYTLSGCRSPEPRFHARDCGDGPFVCDSGYVFHRSASQVRITSDPTPTGDPDAAYLVYDATVPGTQTPTGTSYGTIEAGIGSKAAIYFIKTTNGGATWSPPRRINAARGHQFFPDIDADAGELHAVWQDSRNDCANGPPTTPSGGDFRTVPFSNDWVSTDPPGSVRCGPAAGRGLHAIYAISSNDGATWTSEIVSTVATMPQWEQFGNRDVPFFGDYNYIDAAAGSVLMDWTDQREVVPGVDIRYDDPALAVDDSNDGFDVKQCRQVGTDGTVGPDLCPNAGGLDQNIFGEVR